MPDGHTPGPWTCERVETAVGYAWRVAPIGACLYVDSQRGVANPTMDETEAEADARLIASGPDLLEALRGVAADLAELSAVFAVRGNDMADEQAHLEAADRAIAKATSRNGGSSRA